MAWLREHAETVVSGGWGWDAALTTLDGHLERAALGGETTLVVAVVAGGQVTGASVGDSMGWLFTPLGGAELTERQVSKPRLGSGGARPVAFRHPIPAATSPLRASRLLLATDGVWKYQDHAGLEERALLPDLQTAADTLLQAVKLASGALPDDASLLLAELAE